MKHGTTSQARIRTGSDWQGSETQTVFQKVFLNHSHVAAHLPSVKTAAPRSEQGPAHVSERHRVMSRVNKSS